METNIMELCCVSLYSSRAMCEKQWATRVCKSNAKRSHSNITVENAAIQSLQSMLHSYTRHARHITGCAFQLWVGRNVTWQIYVWHKRTGYDDV